LYYNLIEGWQIGLQLVNKGSKVTLYIPSGLAYGTTGSADGTIASNTNIVFDIDLLDDSDQLTNDVAQIDRYLDSLKINAFKDPSGLRYTVDALGPGAKPTIGKSVYFTYLGKLLKTGTVFDQSTTVVSAYLGFQSRLSPGLIIGFQQITRGSTATFYIPSNLGFGLNPVSSLKLPSGNLIYTVQFTDLN
jgi:FKBP-type peptidyl-prolyl cis-trans isomerase